MIHWLRFRRLHQGINDTPVNDFATDPAHYRGHSSGVQCIEVAQHFNFNLGNVIKYVWRADKKGAALADLKKARQYLDFEIARRQVFEASKVVNQGDGVAS